MNFRLNSIGFILTGVFLLSCNKTQPIRSSLIFLADSIAQNGIEERAVTPYETHSTQMNRFLQLLDSSDTQELVKLSEHHSHVVRYYSLLSISRRDAKETFETLLVHLHDTTEVQRLGGCIRETHALSWYDANEFLDFYLTFQQPRNEHYSQIRQLASDTLIPAALIALARFQKRADEDLIEMRLKQALLRWHFNWARPHYSLTAVREFPTDRFFPYLEKALEIELQNCRGSNGMNIALMQAIVQYPNPAGVKLIKRALEGCSAGGGYKKMMNVYVAVALRQYPNPVFQEVQREIILGPSGERLVEWMSKQ